MQFGDQLVKRFGEMLNHVVENSRVSYTCPGESQKTSKCDGESERISKR